LKNPSKYFLPFAPRSSKRALPLGFQVKTPNEFFNSTNIFVYPPPKKKRVIPQCFNPKYSVVCTHHKYMIRILGYEAVTLIGGYEIFRGIS
jgi:hypothetical protein